MQVSVITPSFNQGQYLEGTILSVLDQDYPDIEYIVIDGGSSDNSKEIILKYADRIAYWISEPDKGQADAINKGFIKSTGDLVCWINSDDILYPGFVSTRVRQFSEYPDVDFIYGDVHQGKDMSGKKLRKGSETDFKKMLISLHVPIPQQSTMWRRSVVERIGLLDTQWHVLLDREYFMRVARKGTILYKPGAVAFFRNHDASKSIVEWRKWADELEKYYIDLFSSELANEYIGLKRFAMAAMYYECAMICNDCNDSEAMKRYRSLSKRINPIISLKQDTIRLIKNVRKRLASY